MVSIVSMAAPVTAEQPARSDANNFAGTYVMDLGNKASGTLAVIQMPDNKLQFDLECNTGAPSYNSGETSGTIAVKNATAIFQTTEFGGQCKIRVEFQKKGVVITQTGSDADCGFVLVSIVTGNTDLRAEKGQSCLMISRWRSQNVCADYGAKDTEDPRTSQAASLLPEINIFSRIHSV